MAWQRGRDHQVRTEGPPLSQDSHSAGPPMETGADPLALSLPTAPTCHSPEPCISICICTYKRRTVIDAVDSALRQRNIPVEIEIVVADDDPETSARDAVLAKANDSPIPIRYVVSGAGNIAASRNACLDSARAPWLAFIDDDEIADPFWLSELWSAHLKYPSMVIKGFVKGVYPENTPDWIRNGDPFTSNCGPTGQELVLGATGNVLFNRELVAREGIRFDLEMGRTGGEDLDFFQRLIARGYRIVACDSAVVYENAIESRLSLKALRRRYRRHAHIDCRLLVAKRAWRSQARIVMQAAVLAALCSTHVLLTGLPGSLAFRMFGRFWYSVGVLEWVCGGTRLQHE
jgi:succinoglycan biosynthesis protein ExoM